MAIYKNNNGTWYVMIRYQDWTGARKQKCKRGFATRKEAADWELQFKMQKKANLDMTMESFCALYEEDVRPSLKQSTWLTKENIIQKKILPYLGQRKVSEITAKDVMDWHNQMRKLKTKYKQLRKEYNALEKEADQVADISNQLLEENERLQNISDRYDRVVRVLGKNTVDLAIQTDIRREKELEQKRLEQMLQGSLSERLKWAESKRDEYNVQRKKNKVKNREMEI